MNLGEYDGKLTREQTIDFLAKIGVNKGVIPYGTTPFLLCMVLGWFNSLH